MRPIKWKGILHRLTICSQKIGQYNSVESLLKMGLIFFHFEDYSKSARWMISFWLVTCNHTPTLYKTAEKVTVIRFFTQTSVGSTVRRSTFFVSMPTLEPHSAAKNQWNSKIKVPTDPLSHVFSAGKISAKSKTLRFFTPDTWPPPKWPIYIGGGTSRRPRWLKFWLRGFLD